MLTTTQDVQVKIDRQQTKSFRISPSRESKRIRRAALDEIERALTGDPQAELNRFGLSDRDVILSAMPMANKHWLDLFDTCISTGVHIILSDAEMDALSLAKTIAKENVTVIATTPAMWVKVCQLLNIYSADTTRIRAILFNGKRNSDLRMNFIPSALSKSKIEDVYAAYRLAPAARNSQKI